MYLYFNFLQVKLCKEKSRAPPPLVPLPASLPMYRPLATLLNTPESSSNVGLETLSELPCEVEIKEDPSDAVVGAGAANRPVSLDDPTSSPRGSCENDAAESDVILLDDSFEQALTSDTESHKRDKGTSILEQVLTGNLSINDCKELAPKPKLTSQWWCSPCNNYYR